MHTKLNWSDAVMLVIWLLPLVYLWYVYPQLPATVAVHFDYKGDPNGFGSKNEFLATVFFMCGINLFVNVLIRFLPRIDPKQKVKYSQPIFIKIGYAILLLLSLLTVLIINSAVHNHFAMSTHILYPALGLLFAYMGNLFNNLKPNYFVGIRTPWTLESEEVWKKTHHMGGRLWLVGGVMIAILTWVLPEKASYVVFLCGTLVLCVGPILYSYLCFRQLKKESL